MCTCILQAGDIVNVDVTAYYKGYHGDLNETFVVGEVDEESKKLTKVAYEVQIWHHCHHTRFRTNPYHLRSALAAYSDGGVQVVLALADMKLIGVLCFIQCLMQAIAAVKPGVRYREMGALISKHAESNG